MALPQKVSSRDVGEVATKLLEKLVIIACKNTRLSIFCPTLFNVSRSDPRAPELGFRRRDLTMSSAGSGEHKII